MTMPTLLLEMTQFMNGVYKITLYKMIIKEMT